MYFLLLGVWEIELKEKKQQKKEGTIIMFTFIMAGNKGSLKGLEEVNVIIGATL